MYLTFYPLSFIQASQTKQSLRILANGFIVRDKTERGNDDGKKQSSGNKKHLISDRDFDDILEACRPRNHREHFGGVPKALFAQMKIFGLIGKEEGHENSIHQEWGSLDLDGGQNDSGSDDVSRSSHSTVTSHFTNAYSFVLSHSQSPGSQTYSSPILQSVQIQQSKSHEMPPFLLNENNLRSVTSDYDKNVFLPDSLAVKKTSR